MKYENILKQFNDAISKNYMYYDIYTKRIGLYKLEYKCHTLNEIGKDLSISGERVRQLESKILASLKNRCRFICNEINGILEFVFQDKRIITADKLRIYLNNDEAFIAIYSFLFTNSNCLKYGATANKAYYIYDKKELKPLEKKKKTNSNKKKSKDDKPLISKEESPVSVDTLDTVLKKFKEQYKYFTLDELKNLIKGSNDYEIRAKLLNEVSNGLVFISESSFKYYGKYDIEVWELGELIKLIGKCFKKYDTILIDSNTAYIEAKEYCNDILLKYKIETDYHFYNFLSFYLGADFKFKNDFIIR